jgi:hypothetical protein
VVANVGVGFSLFLDLHIASLCVWRYTISPAVLCHKKETAALKREAVRAYVRLLRATSALPSTGPRRRAGPREQLSKGRDLAGSEVWLERPGVGRAIPRPTARARALIELEMLLKFWGAAPRTACRRASRPRRATRWPWATSIELDEGPVGIILSYLQKEDHEN